jgi:hypothetical protein
MHGKKNITDTLGLNDTAATYHYYDFALPMLQYVDYYQQWHVHVLLPRRFILEIYENALTF